MTAMPNPKIELLEARILDVLRHRVGKDERAAKPHDWFTATVLALRDDVIDRWMESTRRTYEANGKRVYYLSLEFLIGRLLRDAMTNLGMTRDMELALRHRRLLVVLIFALLAAAYGIYKVLGSEFLPEFDEGAFILDYVAPPGASLAETDRMLQHVERLLKETPVVYRFGVLRVIQI